jgi:hypothetical protein
MSAVSYAAGKREVFAQHIETQIFGYEPRIPHRVMDRVG